MTTLPNDAAPQYRHLVVTGDRAALMMMTTTPMVRRRRSLSSRAPPRQSARKQFAPIRTSIGRRRRRLRSLPSFRGENRVTTRPRGGGGGGEVLMFRKRRDGSAAGRPTGVRRPLS